MNENFCYVKEQQILKIFEGSKFYVSLILKTIKMDWLMNTELDRWTCTIMTIMIINYRI